jgi:hypothetical protein
MRAQSRSAGSRYGASKAQSRRVGQAQHTPSAQTARAEGAAKWSGRKEGGGAGLAPAMKTHMAVQAASASRRTSRMAEEG